MPFKNIALLLGDIRDVYSNAVAKGAIQAAKDKDCNLLIVPGRYYHASKELLLGEYEYQYQTLYSYFVDNNVDCIILAAGSAGFVYDSSERNSLARFREQIGNIPLITISGDAPGVPNIRYDNTTGIVSGINYLVRNQKCLRIAMVAGPKDNVDSKERVEAYRDTLESLGIETDEEYIIYGDFTERTELTVYGFLKSHLEVDALVFANDRMAVGGYEAARKLGLVVGRDIAILGFDNMEKDNYLDPPLASVDADATRLGYAAVAEALNTLQNGDTKGKIIPSRFVIRESVILKGGREIFEETLGYGINEDTDFEQLAENTFDYIYNPINGEMNKTSLFECYRRFLFDLSTVIFGNNLISDRIEVLRFSYKQLFEEDVRCNLDIGRFMMILEAMERAALEQKPSEVKKDAIVRMTSYAYRHLSGLIPLRESERAYRLKKIQHEIYRISADMVGFHSISDKTYASVLTNFERFGINYCYLFLFDKPIRNEITDSFKPDKDIYLKAALVNRETYSPEAEEQRISLSEMFKLAFKESGERTHLIMLNLYIRNLIYGVILCDLPYDIFSYYESFNYQMSNAVRIIRLLKENDEKGKQLKESLKLLTANNIELSSMSKSDELTGIPNRRGFLADVEEKFAKVSKDNPPEYILVGYADVDGLKGVNDNFGHDEGDNLIVACANALKGAMGEKGVIARMGGDEFAAMMLTSDEAEGERFKARLEEEVKKHNDKSLKPYQLSVSMGTFLFPYTKDADIKELLESADKQMYKIKENHRAGRRRGDFIARDSAKE